MKQTSVLFVCMGNICRSPLAEGILAHMAAAEGVMDLLSVDSAGTGGWHAGDPPDPRSVAIARSHGVNIAGQRALQVRQRDFETFDLVLAMDEDNLAKLLQVCPRENRHKVHLFLDFASGRRESVPDPYYGGEDGFLDVYNMLFAGCSSLLAKLERDS